MDDLLFVDYLQEASAKERVASQLLMNEKKILSATIGSLRNRLAPIRGIPTKSGMQV